jgi:hypothetical protein
MTGALVTVLLVTMGTGTVLGTISSYRAGHSWRKMWQDAKWWYIAVVLLFVFTLIV